MYGNNRMVGWLEGLEGLCSLFFAIPFGTLADRWRRDRVLRISSCIELGAHNLAPDHFFMQWWYGHLLLIDLKPQRKNRLIADMPLLSDRLDAVCVLVKSYPTPSVRPQMCLVHDPLPPRVAAVACTIAAVSTPQSKTVLELLGLPLDAKYLLLCLGALLWGTSRAGGNVVDSSLADSVPTGVPHFFCGIRSYPRVAEWSAMVYPKRKTPSSVHALASEG